jgi:hypothetical protein
MGLTALSATIQATGSLSPEVDIGAGVLVGVFVPSGWTSANITFQASPDGGVTWGNVFTYLGSEFTLVATPGQFLTLDPTQLKGLRSLKLRSGTSASPVSQSSTVNVTLLVSLI